jgi:hypothetical protein
MKCLVGISRTAASAAEFSVCKSEINIIMFAILFVPDNFLLSNVSVRILNRFGF